MDERFLRKANCRENLLPGRHRQLQKAQQPVCIVDGTKDGFLIAPTVVVTTRHGAYSPEQLSKLSVEFPQALGGAFKIEPSCTDGRSGYFVPGSDFNTSFPDMQVLIFPALEQAANQQAFGPEGTAGLNPVWADECLKIPEDQRLAFVLHHVHNDVDGKCQLTAFGVDHITADAEFEDLLVVSLPDTEPGSSAAPLVVLGLDDPYNLAVVGYMLGEYAEDDSAATSSTNNSSSSSNKLDRVFLSHVAMLKVLHRLHVQLLAEGNPLGSADVVESTSNDLKGSCNSNGKRLSSASHPICVARASL